MNTIEKVYLTNSCQCYDCTNPDCSTLTLSTEYEPECDFCQAPTKPADYCDGICYESEKDYLENNLFTSWLTSVGEPDYLKVSGRGVGWRNLSGYDIVKADMDTLLEYLSINGEWSLWFTFEGAEFSLVRSSHDEPTGAYYNIEPLVTLSNSMSIDEAIMRGILDEYGCHNECGEYFYDCSCEVK